MNSIVITALLIVCAFQIRKNRKTKKLNNVLRSRIANLSFRENERIKKESVLNKQSFKEEVVKTIVYDSFYRIDTEEAFEKKLIIKEILIKNIVRKMLKDEAVKVCFKKSLEPGFIAEAELKIKTIVEN